ncbi:DUF4159 domain-containing protein [Silicimonas algicola]|uniref:Putative membrane protein (TIGR02226 family) n=1 Tax=Silicimonas algicola TaxID=1826607 RepID=A0A316GGI8_9RHOB|nr:DUF4159 domain-containing protein [Silicimonas algicola]AZQ66198.1 DUF4159 domain-containing protein [Silicimonas algicola]PWK58510.1 putative membrane protein (TIGR02226 family) [Silicimonas algicola]
MFMLGPLGFLAPWLLLGLVMLPILWLLLRAVPPAPIRRRFPGVALLLGLTDDETQTDRTPWWLLLLRTIAIAAAIIGFAGPILNPKADAGGTGPLLVLVDDTWAAAQDWNQRIDRIETLLVEATQAGRETAVVAVSDLTPDAAIPFRAAQDWSATLPMLEPKPWMPEAEAVTAWAEELSGGFDTFWLSDGVDQPWRSALLDSLQDRGAVSVFEAARPVVALKPAVFEDGAIRLSAIRNRTGSEAEISVAAHGLDPAGIPRQLATVDIAFAAGEAEASALLSLPAELRNRVTRFEISGARSAGAVTLGDDSLRRREIAIVAARDEREGLQLLSQTHYLEQALEPNADLIHGAISDLVLANPDVIVLADVVSLAGAEAEALEEWTRKGGLLVRFAGPRLAASDLGREAEDVLMPVRLRAGGRTVGGAMSWGEPKALRTFSAESPFFGLPIPEDVTVSSQVMAQPDPTLAERTIATLADGTPLVTRKRLDLGQVVLFHVTANAEWSTLPLSGLFVQMLERLAVSTRLAALEPGDLVGTTWTLDQAVTGFGEVVDAGTTPGIAGERLAGEAPGPELPPGLYAGETRRIALNAVAEDMSLAPVVWPGDVTVEGFAVAEELPLKGALLSLALLALMIDVFATLLLSGRLSRQATAAALVVLAMALPAPRAEAQEELDVERLIAATSEVTLAHVVTGDAAVDEAAQAGMQGLSQVLFRRTSIEPGEPVAVNLETDELSVYPFLYWPITEQQPRPSEEAYEKLNLYLRTGGLILFDTRDAGTAGFTNGSPNGRKLQQLALPLDIPPLEPIPADHVLTRTFYLLQDFPGRHISRDVWVEAAPADAQQAEGMPFRNLNDNVTPVVIGGNDWATAWASDENGRPLYPVGRGFAGERQREMAYRFGVNLVMHVLTGNYKSDQVHVPALLDRLGQ